MHTFHLLLVLASTVITTAGSIRRTSPIVEDNEGFDYGSAEDRLNIEGLNAIARLSPNEPRKGLSYTGWLIFDNPEPVNNMVIGLARANEKGTLIGVDGSFITVTSGSIKPEKASFMLFYSTSTGAIPAVGGRLRIEAWDGNGQKHSENAFFNYEYLTELAMRPLTLGKVKEQPFPSSWKTGGVTKMQVFVEHSSIDSFANLIANIKEYLGFTSIVGGGAGSVLATGFLMDDMTWTV